MINVRSEENCEDLGSPRVARSGCDGLYKNEIKQHLAIVNSSYLAWMDEHLNYINDLANFHNTERIERLKSLLPSLQEGDWYEDEDGIIWLWEFDLDANIYRWWQIDLDIVGTLDPMRELSYLSGIQKSVQLERYGYNGELFKRTSSLSPYRRTESL